MGYLATNFGQRIDFRILEYLTLETTCSQQLDSLVQVFPQTLASASMLLIPLPRPVTRQSPISEQFSRLTASSQYAHRRR